ncbi:MAG TPA: hypothetical protein DCM87_03505 [Planctomycetes bacterium]|nr:hypothetical protein [Planctomycetota bacterium]
MMLALTFLSPGSLFLLGAAAVPIIIHFLARRRWRVVRWAAMEFLLRAMRRQRRRLRFENLLLLALRVGAIVCLALAAGRPVGEQDLLPAAAAQRRGVIVALDASYSMLYQEAGRSVLDRGRELAKDLLAKLGSGDRLVILRAGEFTDPVFDDRVTDDARLRAREIIDMLAPAHAAMDVYALLREIARSAAEIAGEGLSARAVVFTDLQAKDWLRPGRKSDPKIGESLQALARAGTALEVFDLGSLNRLNLEVCDLRIDRTLAAADVPVIVQGAVRNYSAEDAAGIAVDLIADGRQVQGRTLASVPAGETRAVAFRHTFRDAGVHSLALVLTTDALATDNSRYLAVNVRKVVNVLLVDGAEAAEGRDRATFYLEAALSPLGDSLGEALSPFRVETVPLSRLTAAALEGKDAAVVADADRLAMAGPLKELLARGGAVLVFLGPNVDADAYNRDLLAAGDGGAALRLLGPAGDPGLRLGVKLRPKALDHPFVQFFVDRDDVRLDGADVWRYVRVEAGEGARVLAVYSNPDASPAIVELSRPQGSFVLVTTTADAAWTNLPKWPDFVPLVHELLASMTAPGGADRNLLVGWPFARAYPAAAYAGEVRIRAPQGGITVTSLRNAGEGAQGDFRLAYDKTDEAGLYEVTLLRQSTIDPLLRERYPEKDLFAVNLAGGEGDLTPAGEAELRAAYGDAAPRVIAPGEGRADAQVARNRQREFWRPLLWAMALLFAAEAFCATLFGRRQR